MASLALGGHHSSLSPSSSSYSTLKPTIPRWGRNALRIIFTAAATAVIVTLLAEEGGGVGGVPGMSIFSYRTSTSRRASSRRGGGGGGAGDVPEPLVWDDAMLYTPAGMDFDSYKLMPKGNLAPFTEETQAHLFQHQFPMTCEGQKFLISHGNDNSAGMGSHLHISGMHLGLALELDRIFIWGSNVGVAYTDIDTCNGKTNVECFFRSPSNCTLADAMKEGANTIEARYGLAAADYKIKYWFTPTAFRSIWQMSGRPIGLHELKYWWRAQSVAFLARFNEESIALLKKLRTAQGKVVHWPTDSQWAERMATSFPIERGAVSVHVRHGDKQIEMALVEDFKYFDAAEKVVVNDPMGHTRLAYVSTEDPAVMESAKKYNNSAWSFLWYDVPRINSNGIDQISKLGMPKGYLSHIWWLQLLMALECDAWIGTRGSNWNRLIDELRCVWVSPFRAPFACGRGE
jgi:hypothetical protein